MQMTKLGTVAAVLAATLMVGSTTASAQMKKKNMHGHAVRVSASADDSRPLTVTAPASAPATVAGVITAPLSGLSQAFGYGPLGGPSRPLPIVARYAGVGPVTDSVNQGWAQPVPVTANGPVYKLEPVSNSGGVSPFTLIAAPITAATTLAAAPFNAAGALVGAPPPPPPVF